MLTEIFPLNSIIFSDRYSSEQIIHLLRSTFIDNIKKEEDFLILGDGISSDVTPCFSNSLFLAVTYSTVKRRNVVFEANVTFGRNLMKVKMLAVVNQPYSKLLFFPQVSSTIISRGFSFSSFHFISNMRDVLVWSISQ